MAESFHTNLLKSEKFAEYSLRSSFFLRRLRAMRLWEAIDDVQRLLKVKASFNWDDRIRFGIDAQAWELAKEFRIEPLLYFCHPRVLLEQPRLLLYYRTVCLISQKGLSTLVKGDLAKIERGGVEHLPNDRVQQMSIALNSIASALIATAAQLKSAQLPGLQFVTAGATIQGGWNNQIGVEGEIAVKTILFKYLQNELAQVVWKNGRTLDYEPSSHEELIDRIQEVKVLRLKQGYHIRFASEPDISLRDRDDVPRVAVEVKAGNDTGGALERLGAGMKSFENDRNLNPRLKTVYVVRSLTAELDKRIREGDAFDHTFRLSELLVDERTQMTFANLLLKVVLSDSASHRETPSIAQRKKPSKKRM